MAAVKRFQAQRLEVIQIWIIAVQALPVLTKMSSFPAFRQGLRSFDDARDAPAFAADEISKDYPRISAHALIGLWGAFQIMVEDLLVAFLINDPEILRNEDFSKIKIAMADYELLESEERMRYLLSEFEKVKGIRRSFGTERFERMLNPFGLTGAVDSEVSKSIREMHFTRNVIVHRASEADRRMVEGCPWLNLKIGQPIVVGLDKLVRFDGALSDYGTEIIHRVSAKFGIDSRKAIVKPNP